MVDDEGDEEDDLDDLDGPGNHSFDSAGKSQPFVLPYATDACACSTTDVPVGSQEKFPDFHVEQFWGVGNRPDAVRIIMEVGSYKDGKGHTYENLLRYSRRVREYIDFVGPNRCGGGPMLGIAIVGSLVFTEWKFHSSMRRAERNHFTPLPRVWYSLYDPAFVRALNELRTYCVNHH